MFADLFGSISGKKKMKLLECGAMHFNSSKILGVKSLYMREVNTNFRCKCIGKELN